jgi:hypothetical protein
MTQEDTSGGALLWQCKEKTKELTVTALYQRRNSAEPKAPI